MKTIAIIPTRLNSTRLPRKVLLKNTGKYLVQHVYEQAVKSKADQVIVAADNEEIQKACEEFNAPCYLTSPNHESGTDRIAEVAKTLECDLILNIQGDEPEIDPAHINQLIDFMIKTNASVGTLAENITTKEDYVSPNVVKVVVNKLDEALFFSRAPIPYPRNTSEMHPLRHLGIYAFKKDFLETFTSLEPTDLEKLESLEQLRILDYGYKIHVDVIDGKSQNGIDTLKDYQNFIKRYLGNEIS